MKQKCRCWLQKRLLYKARKEGRKAFFFEEKKQKTFNYFVTQYCQDDNERK
jgi:hypothetical protein